VTRYNIDSIGKQVSIVIDNSGNNLLPISSIYSHLHLYNIIHKDFTLAAEWGQSKQKNELYDGSFTWTHDKFLWEFK